MDDSTLFVMNEMNVMRSGLPRLVVKKMRAVIEWTSLASSGESYLCSEKAPRVWGFSALGLPSTGVRG